MSIFTVCHINENLNSSLNNTHEVDDPNLIELCVQSKTSRRREIIKIHPVSTPLIYFLTMTSCTRLLMEMVGSLHSSKIKGVSTISFLFDPAHDKTYKKTCVTSKDSVQPVHAPSMSRVLIYPSLDSSEAIEGTCNR